MKLGILGGTFDPIHLGHVALAEAALRCAGLDRVLVVPAQVPPHKTGTAASAADRYEMARRALAGVDGVELSDLEVRRPGPSYTLDTLRQVRAEQPDAELYLVLGWDAARLLREWREPGEVVKLAHLLVFPRPGTAPPTPGELAAAGLDLARTTVCEEGTPDVAATEVRGRIRAGKPLDGLVHPGVAEYIRARGLYASRARG